jgi:predicted SnoaL-like aldol condensation-catalyzing enzyme
MTMTQSQNKALVLQAFDTLFNRRDYAAAERLWSPAYIQHSAHIAPGREGLFELVRAAPKELRYENALIVAEGDYGTMATCEHGDDENDTGDRERRNGGR